MNFADALRQAQGGIASLTESVMESAPETVVQPGRAFETEASGIELAAMGDGSLVSASGNVVRLELLLDPSQMNAMLKALINSHQCVMTLREAANYLRISSQKLERLAAEHEAPGFMIDGRWRFPKVALDEWLSVQATRSAMEEEDAA
jgi:excisionase family DNA binding protein